VAGLACRDLRAGYNGTPVLQGVNVEVAAGEWVALIGPNGAGKSTLLRAVVGTLECSGEVLVGGAPTAAMPRRTAARAVAMVPQHPVIPEGMAVFDYALLGRTPHIPAWGFERPSDEQRVIELLERLDLTELAERPLDRLSGGELQRAILARALAQDATVLLLDEPTASLDLGHQQQVLDLVDELRREQGLAVLSALHDLTLAAQYADRLVLLREGAVVAQGRSEEVITLDALKAHYGASVSVLRDEDGGIVVAPRRTHSK
jgi:iron complex transport system ATP-binding protein